MTREISELPIRGSIGTMRAYLGDAQISAEEFVKYKPQVPLGLLKALGLTANSVPLPTEDPATLVMNSANKLIQSLSPEDREKLAFIEVGTESIKDGSLPLSQYALEFIDHDDIISNESKHACVAAINAIWRNIGDSGLVIASDIATYGDDENTAASAEFTGGMGSVAMHLDPDGELLNILNARGASSGLTHDFFKPYDQEFDELSAKTYPIVFGRYSNLANIERVGLAYENLKKRVDISLDTFSGIALHAPYPGISKYNIAFLVIIDRKDSGDEEAKKMYTTILELIRDAHRYFTRREMDKVDELESEVKGYLKQAMYEKNKDGDKSYTKDYEKAYNKIKPSLELIRQTGNLYTGSSPLCMMSLLENKEFDAEEYLLWGGYGSGNQAIFMIAKTTDVTTSIAETWNTQEDLDSRRMLTAEEFTHLKSIGPRPYNEILTKNGMTKLLRPRDLYYLSNCDEFHIKQYTKYKPTQSSTATQEEEADKIKS